MQSRDMIEVVTHLLAVGSVKLLYSRMRLPFLRALRLYWWRRGRTFHSDVRHRSLPESDVVLLVGKVEIPVIGRDGEISGVLCRNLVLTYFDPAVQRETLARVAERMVDGAALIVGKGEELPTGLEALFAPWPELRCTFRRLTRAHG